MPSASRPRPSPLLASLLVATTFLAGCSGGAPPEGETIPSGTASSSPMPGGAAANGTATEALLPPSQVRYFLTAEGGLSPTRPAAGAFAMPFNPAIFALRDQELPDFLSGPTVGPAFLTGPAAQVDLWIEADLPMASNQAFDVGVWLGTTRSVPLSALSVLPVPAQSPGTPIHLNLSLEWGGLADVPVAAGDALRLIVGAFGDYGAGTARLRVGGETASSITFVVQPVLADPLAGAAGGGQELTGTLRNAQTVDCQVQEGVSHLSHAVGVDGNATILAVALERSDGLPQHADLDLDLLDGERRLAAGHTPYGHEAVVLAGPAVETLRGRTLTVLVTLCVGGQADYRVSVAQT